MKYFYLFLLLHVLISCRKEIEFENVNSSTGLINSEGDVHDGWEIVDKLNRYELNKIVSDGNYLYLDAMYQGSRSIFRLDSSGTFWQLFQLENNNAVTTLEYIAPYVYSAQSEIYFSAIKAFNETGIQITYDIDFLSDHGANVIYDYGNELLIGGMWNASTVYAKPTNRNVGLINKQTGVYTAMGDFAGTVFDLIEYNGELYVGASKNGSNSAFAKWNGVDWYNAGGPNGFYANSIQSMMCQSLEEINGQLYVSGVFAPKSVLARVNFNGTPNNTTFSESSVFEYADNGSNFYVSKRIRLEKEGNEFYLFGDVKSRYSDFTSCFRFSEGKWKGYSRLETLVIDAAFHQGYVYVIGSDDRIYRHKNF